MKSSRTYARTLAAALMASGLTVLAIPNASADPDAQTESPAPTSDPAPVNVSAATPPDGPDIGAVADACKQFGAALDFAATHYEDFAYATAGSGNNVNYQDPSVVDSNVLGRTALREAAAAGLAAASTPGLPGDVAAPMRSWSLHATKLLVIMGVRGGGDSLNSTADDMNTDANNAQMACALNGARA
ncbi:hypothetical protein ACXDF8_23685 [Mycolicibacterium sp. CBM1]